MYDYVKGVITENYGNVIVVEANGVGYELNVSTFAAERLAQSGSVVKAYCRLSVREDGMSLFGFYDKAERDVFDKLTLVSGIGAKLALTILSGLNVQALSAAVARQDVKLISSIKGVGKKTAERIVLELKDKFVAKAAGEGAPIVSAVAVSDLEDEAATALAGLGFNKQQAIDVVKRVIKDGMTVEDVILAALKAS